MYVRRRKRRVKKKRGGIYESTKMKKQFRYRSSWELAYMKYLDFADEIESYDYEFIRIPYISNKKSGKIRNYIPDFLICYVSGSKQIVEIKPSSRVANIKNRKKFAAATIYCSQNNLEFIILTEVELKKMKLL